MTSELSDPEDRVRVEVDEAREGSEELTEEEGRGLTTYLWASSSHSQGRVIRALSGQNKTQYLRLRLHDSDSNAL